MAQSLVTGITTPGATVTVYWYGTTTKPTINVSDGGSAASNPITANTNDGSYSFWVSDGHYKIVNGSTAGDVDLHVKQGSQVGKPSVYDIATEPFLGSTETNLGTLLEKAIAGTLSLSGGTFTGPITTTDSTASTSIVTGSFKTAGGAGITKGLYVGEVGNFLGQLQAAATTQSTTPLTGSFICSGGAGIAKDTFLGGFLNLVTANGANLTFAHASEEITLGTSATNHDSVANLLPANSLILAVTGRVTTALTGGTKAVGTITMSGVATADETFVIGSQTFTWKASRSGAGEVTIGAGAAEAVTNIVAAITADIPTIATAVDGAGDTVVVTAVTGGVAGNAIVFTENSTNMAVDGAGFLGGTTPGVDIASWTLADTATATRFANANTTISTSGNSIGLNHWKGGVASDAAGPTQASAAKVRITTNVIPSGGGKIRVTVYYATFTAPTS